MILINALNVGHGGGRVILEELMNEISISSENIGEYVVILNPYLLSSFKQQYPFVNFLDLSDNFFYRKAPFLFYFLCVPICAKVAGATLIFNLGNFPVLSCKKQITYLHWPYAVYSVRTKGIALSFRSCLIRYFKKIIFIIFKNFCSDYVVQSSVMAEKLNDSLFFRKPRVVINRPIVSMPVVNVPKKHSSLFYGDYLFYPAFIYPHKNHKIILEVAKYLKNKNTKLKILLTLDFEDKFSKAFMDQVERYSLNDFIVNVGVLDRVDAIFFLKNSRALFMPTLLETLGIPFLEALHISKPILTSNRNFALEICKDKALYFDPLNPVDIANVIISFTENNFIIDTRRELLKGIGTDFIEIPRLLNYLRSQ